MKDFRQVDVFGSRALTGNPVAVVHAADDVSDEQMQAFARWTNLSETTFLLSPTREGADYRLRIFTPSGELPFAGHPTLGSAHAWLEAGGKGRDEAVLVQECGAGLVQIRTNGDALAFAAPPLVRSGPVSESDLDEVIQALGIRFSDVVDAQWCDNGPGWIGVLLRSADAVLAVKPDAARFDDMEIGVIGRYSPQVVEERGVHVEVRAFCPGLGVVEDPVTGSLNAALAQWLIGNGTLPDSYVASQGTVVGRAGRVHVQRDGDTVWVSGATRTTISGSVSLR